MRKRIVERTLMSGKKQYRVEVAKTIMGVVLFWTLDARHDPLYPDRDTAAVFSTLEEACAHCGIGPVPDRCIREDVIMDIEL